MESVTQKIEAKYRKKKVADVKSGDTVRVFQKIKEGSKERVQVFEGLVIRVKRQNSLTNSITVRRIASGVGVEKSFLLHSPLVEKIEVVKRSDVNRKYLTYMRNRSGKSARLESVEFDRDKANEQAAEALIQDAPEEVDADKSDEAKAEAASIEQSEKAPDEEAAKDAEAKVEDKATERK